MELNFLIIIIVVCYLAYLSNRVERVPLPTTSTTRVDIPTSGSRKALRREVGASGRGTGYIYAWQDPDQPGFVKIGRATNWKERINSFQTAVPKTIKVVCVIKVADPVRAEKLIHERHKQYRVKLGGGVEWFKSHKSVINYLTTITD